MKRKKERTMMTRLAYCFYRHNDGRPYFYESTVSVADKYGCTLYCQRMEGDNAHEFDRLLREAQENGFTLTFQGQNPDTATHVELYEKTFRAD